MSHETAFSGDRLQDYPLAVRQAQAVWEPDIPLVSNLANLSAILKECMDRTTWVGFYLWDEARSCLVLGPFQGRAACTRIGLGRGVCGTAAATLRTQLVPDVHEFPGHIACDSASRSEIVVPMAREGRLLGVLDVDSPQRARFDAVDQEWLEKLVAVVVTLWPRRG